MRRMTTLLMGVLLAVGFAGSASALSVDPNPVNFSGYRTAGSVSFSIANDAVLTMEISVTQGKLARSRVRVTDTNGDARGVVAYGAGVGDGVNVRRIRLRSDGSVEFYFKQSFFRNYIGRGQTSDPHFVVYDTLAAGDTITFTGFRHSIFGSFGSVQATIVPEPSAAIMVGLGIVGLAIAGRRR